MGLRRLLVLAVSKMITRPLVATALNLLDGGNTLVTTYNESQLKFDKQSQQSNLYMGGDEERRIFSEHHRSGRIS